MPISDPEYLRRETWSLVEAACLLAGVDPVPIEKFNQYPGTGGLAAHIYANLKEATDEDGALTCRGTRTGLLMHRRVIPWDVVQWAIGRGDAIPNELRAIPRPTPTAAPLQTAPGEKSATATEPYFSDKLTALIQAARRFWENADPEDRGTHPDNRDVVAWLIEQHKFSESLADKGATIIRPKWAGTGRKPEK